MADPIHHLKLTFDPAFGSVAAELVCPETGCQPPGYCSECGRERGAESAPCDMCTPDDSAECCAKGWCDNGEPADWLDGTVTLPVEIGWESGENPDLTILEPPEPVVLRPLVAGTLTEELVLRLADVAAVLATVETDDDGEITEAHTAGLLSALDYALRGASGCTEPDEWQERRRRALAKHGVYLGLGEPA